MKKITVDMDMSDYDIAMDFYQSLMHFVINNKENDINVDAVIENLKFIYDTDLTPIDDHVLCYKIRNKLTENV